MLRIILKRERFEEVNQMRTTDHYTIDIESPELERELTRGGFGEQGFDVRSIVDVEVLPPKQNRHPKTQEVHLTK